VITMSFSIEKCGIRVRSKLLTGKEGVMEGRFNTYIELERHKAWGNARAAAAAAAARVKVSLYTVKVRKHVRNWHIEHKIIAALNRYGQVVRTKIIATGDRNSVTFFYVDILAFCYEYNDAYGFLNFVTYHNHPSKRALSPSSQDIVSTKMTQRVLEKHGFNLVEDIIFNRSTSISMGGSCAVVPLR